MFWWPLISVGGEVAGDRHRRANFNWRHAIARHRLISTYTLLISLQQVILFLGILDLNCPCCTSRSFISVSFVCNYHRKFVISAHQADRIALGCNIIISNEFILLLLLPLCVFNLQDSLFCCFFPCRLIVLQLEYTLWQRQ